MLPLSFFLFLNFFLLIPQPWNKLLIMLGAYMAGFCSCYLMYYPLRRLGLTILQLDEDNNNSKPHPQTNTQKAQTVAVKTYKPETRPSKIGSKTNETRAPTSIIKINLPTTLYAPICTEVVNHF